MIRSLLSLLCLVPNWSHYAATVIRLLFYLTLTLMMNCSDADKNKKCFHFQFDHFWFVNKWKGNLILLTLQAFEKNIAQQIQTVVVVKVKKYSQTCVQRPPSGLQNCAHCWQVVVVQRYVYAINMENGTPKQWSL